MLPLKVGEEPAFLMVLQLLKCDDARSKLLLMRIGWFVLATAALQAWNAESDAIPDKCSIYMHPILDSVYPLHLEPLESFLSQSARLNRLIAFTRLAL